MVRDRIIALDYAKVIAITLVVVGHYIQINDRSFDSNIFFKMIYSFHMPLFIMLSGIASRTWLSQMDTSTTLKSLTKTAFGRILKSLITLYLPFVSWAIVAHLIAPDGVSIIRNLREVIKFPDHGMWFLPCLFWCIFYITCARFGFTLIYQTFPRFRAPRAYQIDLVEFFVIVVIWNKMKFLLPRDYGFAFSNYFHEGLFVYFLIGVYISKYLAKISSSKWIILTTSVFYFSLAPYWVRTDEHSISMRAPHLFQLIWISDNFAFICSAAGSLTVILLSFQLARIKMISLQTRAAKVAELTLGIYAIHEYFLFGPLAFLNSLILSIFWSGIILKIPYLNTLMLGRPIYQNKRSLE